MCTVTHRLCSSFTWDIPSCLFNLSRSPRRVPWKGSCSKAINSSNSIHSPPWSHTSHLPLVLLSLYVPSNLYLVQDSDQSHFQDCKTRYYSNYSVTAAGEPNAVRKYYNGVPDYIEVTDHYFVERELCTWFGCQFAFPQYVASSLLLFIYRTKTHQKVILIKHCPCL